MLNHRSLQELLWTKKIINHFWLKINRKFMIFKTVLTVRKVWKNSAKKCSKKTISYILDITTWGKSSLNHVEILNCTIFYILAQSLCTSLNRCSTKHWLMQIWGKTPFFQFRGLTVKPWTPQLSMYSISFYVASESIKQLLTSSQNGKLICNCPLLSIWLGNGSSIFILTEFMKIDKCSDFKERFLSAIEFIVIVNCKK